MNAFLVVKRCQSDDIPILLTADEAEAMRVAEETTERDGESAERVLSLDTTPVNVSVWLFVGGKLVGSRLVKELFAESN